jgi:dTMP kinase
MTREPGGSENAEKIRQILVEGDVERWDPIAETLLHIAARRAHLTDLVEPALREGRWVLCDRFADSTEAYQGYGQGVDRGFIAYLRARVVGEFEPDLTILLDIAVERGLRRALSRGGAARYEQMDISMHERIRAGFLEMARNQADRFVIVNADRPIDAIEAEIRNCIDRRFGLN